ncbi:hypothetical protein OG589_06440 [Sphaerisporangium sp. NBC_01403]|uniref:hypothetical protein n=1 Tax=Sphaerisporangium sp. NBC_01403 TaxID=2903599 RepID=UPI00324D7C93
MTPFRVRRALRGSPHLGPQTVVRSRARRSPAADGAEVTARNDPMVHDSEATA